MKQIIFPCELKVDFEEVEGEIKITVSAHYGIGSEGIETRRGTNLDLSAEELTLIKNFTKNIVLPKIKEKEEISEIV